MYSLVLKEEKAHDNTIWSCAVNKQPCDDGDIIITGSVDDTVKAWQWLDDRLNLRYIFEGHALGVISVDIVKEGNIAASSSLDCHIRLWDLVSGNQVQSIDAGPVDSWTVCFSPDSNLVATGGNTGRINLYDVKTGKLSYYLDPSGKFALSIAFSPDGKKIASGDINGIISIFDVETMQSLGTFEGHAKPIRSLVFSNESDKLISASDDAHIKIYDLTRTELSEGNAIVTLSGHGSWVFDLAVSPDSEHFASCSADKTVKIWEFGSREPVHTFKEHKDEVWSCRYNYNGSRLVSVSADQALHIYSCSA